MYSLYIVYIKMHKLSSHLIKGLVQDLDDLAWVLTHLSLRDPRGPGESKDFSIVKSLLSALHETEVDGIGASTEAFQKPSEPVAPRRQSTGTLRRSRRHFRRWH